MPSREQIIKKYSLNTRYFQTSERLDDSNVASNLIDIINAFANKHSFSMDQITLRVERWWDASHLEITGSRRLTSEELDKEIENLQLIEEQKKAEKKAAKKKRQENERKEYLRLKEKYEKTTKVQP